MAPHSSSRYEYTQLPARCYRIFNLRAGTDGEPLVGKLVQTSLPSLHDEDGPAQPPSYEAVSYAWDRSEREERRSKLNLGDRRYIRLSSGLHGMLLHLRLPDRNRKLWIDQICINQKDATEKSSQVAIVRSIYSEATCTIVWLGSKFDTDNESLEVFKSFEPLRTEAVRRMDLDMAKTPPTSREETFASLIRDLECLGDVGIAALDKLTSQKEAMLKASNFYTHRWFGRLWPLQEIVVSSHVLMQCGNDTVAWQYVGFFASLFLVHCRRMSIPASAKRGLEAAVVIYWHQLKDVDHFPLFDLLLTVRKFDTTEMVDKIYGILGLSDEYHDAEKSQPSNTPLAVNYSTSYRDLYTKIVRYVMQRNASLEILACVENHCCFNDHLPSWVPDWNDWGQGGPSFWLHNAPEHLNFCAGPLATANILGSTTTSSDELAVRGAIVDRVVEVRTHIHPDYYQSYPTLKELAWDRLVDWVHASMPDLSTSTEAHEAILQQCVTFTAGRIYPGNTISAVTFPGNVADRHTDIQAHKANYCALVERVLSHVNRPRSGSWKMLEIAMNETLKSYGKEANPGAYAEDLTTYTWKRTLLRTANGRIALGPQVSQPGDLIAVLHGGRVPFLMQEREGIEKRYRLVGACYVNGIMYGECREQVEKTNEEFVLV